MMTRREIAEDLYKAGTFEQIILKCFDEGRLPHLDCSRLLNLLNKYGVECEYNRTPYLWNQLYELRNILIDLLAEE